MIDSLTLKLILNFDNNPVITDNTDTSNDNRDATDKGKDTPLATLMNHHANNFTLIAIFLTIKGWLNLKLNTCLLDSGSIYFTLTYLCLAKGT